MVLGYTKRKRGTKVWLPLFWSRMNYWPRSNNTNIALKIVRTAQTTVRVCSKAKFHKAGCREVCLFVANAATWLQQALLGTTSCKNIRGIFASGVYFKNLDYAHGEHCCCDMS